MHELVFHVLTESGNELESVFKEQIREGSRDRATIPKQLAAQMFDHLGNGLTVIDIAGSQTTCQQLPAVVDGQMQLEAVKPSRTALAALGVSGKDAMLANALRMTGFQRRGVNEANTRASSIAVL